MPNFVLKSIKSVKGKQQFKQLVILPDSANPIKIQEEIDKCERENIETIDGEFDKYEKNAQKKYESSLVAIIAIMDRVANLQSVSQDKFKDITPHQELIKEYEFKFKDLRVYAIKNLHGKIILLGGYKNSQKSDITKFRSLKKQYLNYLKNEKR